MTIEKKERKEGKKKRHGEFRLILTRDIYYIILVYSFSLSSCVMLLLEASSSLLCVSLGTGGDANSSMSRHGPVGHLGIPPITTA